MLFSKSSQGSLILILDIQSSIVRASLVQMRDGLLPRIIYSYTKNIPFRKNSGSGHIIHATLEALKEIMAGIHHFIQTYPHKNQIPSKIHEAHVALSSPWVISQAKTLVHHFKQPTEVTQKLIFDILSKERENLIPSLGKGQMDIIEEKISSVRLNGYSVNSWKQKKTKDLEVSFSMSVAGSNTADLFRGACTIVPRNRIHFHSSLLLQYIAIQQLMPARSAYALVHVHGELTDVAVINNHSCTFFGSFPTGAYSVVRKIAREGKTDIEVADSAVSMYTQNSLDRGQQKITAAAVEEGLQLWASEFRKMFESLTPPVAVPARTILCAHVHEDFFIKGLKAAYIHMQPELLTVDQIKPFIEYAVDDPVRLSGLYTMALRGMMGESVI